MTQFLLLRLVANLVKLFGLTYRFRYHGTDNLDKADNHNKGGGHIIAIWHQNAVAGIISQKGVPHTIMISKSKDGEYVAHTCKKFGHIPVRGSSSRGGHAAIIKMVDKLNESGISGAITVDGPRGPYKDIKNGIFQVAKQTNRLIIPYTTVAERYWSFNSWDKFRLPKPFTKIHVYYGEPIEVEAKLDENYIKELKEKLFNALEKCEDQAREFIQ